MRTPEQEKAAYNGMKLSTVAKMLDCSRGHVLELVRKKALDAVDISAGSRPEYRVSRESLDAFLEARKVA